MRSPFAECAQTFLLHDGLLRLAQLIIGALQGTVELRLMSGQGDVLTQLAQEFAFAAAENSAFRSGRQGGRQRPGSPSGAVLQPARAGRRAPALRKRELRRADVGFVDQLPAHAAGQSIRVDCDAGLLGQREFQRQRLALDPGARDSEQVVDGVI